MTSNDPVQTSRGENHDTETKRAKEKDWHIDFSNVFFHICFPCHGKFQLANRWQNRSFKEVTIAGKSSSNITFEKSIKSEKLYISLSGEAVMFNRGVVSSDPKHRARVHGNAKYYHQLP